MPSENAQGLPGDEQPAQASGRDPAAHVEKPSPAPALAREIGGPRGAEPTRYGDWERAGRCIDF
jgi:hypothetical protein